MQNLYKFERISNDLCLNMSADYKQVNDASLLGASHSEAVSALREAGNSIKLLVCDGWNDPTGPPIYPEHEHAANGHHEVTKYLLKINWN